MKRTTSYIRDLAILLEGGATLSDTAKLSARSGVVRLKPQRRSVKLPGRGIEAYPLDDDLFVRTESFAPGALVSFGFVEVLGSTPVDEGGAEVTSFGFRAFDGTDAKWWDGSAWSVAAAGEWNTLAEFNANLPTLDATEIAVDLRLKTTDDGLTPTASGLRLQWTGEVVNPLTEWIFRGLVASLRRNLRPTTTFVVTANGLASVDLTGAAGAGFVLASVLEAYDLTDDPTRETNLALSFVPSTEVLTLSAAVDVGNELWIVASYAPDVAVVTSTDYVADAKIPAVWVTSIVPRSTRKRLGGVGPAIVDRSISPPLATVFPLPVPLVDLDLTVSVLAPSALDLFALCDALTGWIESHPVLTSTALDEGVAVSALTPVGWQSDTSDFDDVRSATLALSFLDVPLYPDASAASASDGVSQAPVDGVPAVGRLLYNWRPADGGDETT